MTTEQLLLIIGMTAVTFGVRYPVLAIFGRLNLSPTVMRALRYVPPAVLTAIIVPGVISPTGTPDLSLTNAYLIAGIASVGIAAYTRKLLPTIVIGMAIFLAWRVITGV